MLKGQHTFLKSNRQVVDHLECYTVHTENHMNVLWDWDMQGAPKG